MNSYSEQWIRPAIKALSAYHVPDPGKLIKLDAMENPYVWPESLKQQWLQTLHAAEINRYPDPSAARLKQVLRSTMVVPDDMDILLGNGSDEIIQILAMAVAEPGRVIMAPEPSFVMYKMIATFTAMQYVGVPLNDDFSLNVEAMLAAIEQHQPAITFLAFPNNPTGNLFDKDDVKAIIEASSGIVVLDEAYHAFADSSFMDQLSCYDNLLVMRTVSKMGLAGLRLGCLAGSKAWLTELDKIRLPYNINILTQLSAEFALSHQAMLDDQTQKICAEREILFDKLQSIEQVTPFPSQANFILFRVPAGKAADLFQSIKSKGVLIKNMHGSSEQCHDCLRVTVGKPEENAAFISALETSL